jgi:hypothetical protein
MRAGFCLRLATMGSLGFAEARKQKPDFSRCRVVSWLQD